MPIEIPKKIQIKNKQINLINLIKIQFCPCHHLFILDMAMFVYVGLL